VELAQFETSCRVGEEPIIEESEQNVKKKNSLASLVYPSPVGSGQSAVGSRQRASTLTSLALKYSAASRSLFSSIEWLTAFIGPARR
jgi:hypothetical protein